MKLFTGIFISLLSWNIAAQVIDSEIENKPIQFEKILFVVKNFFKVFGDGRGCLSGAILDKAIAKWIDPELKTRAVCLTNSRDLSFDLNWNLKDSKKYYSQKLKTHFSPKGTLKVSLDKGVLKIEVFGLKYQVLKGIEFKIKLLTLWENTQHLELSTSGFLSFVKLTSSIQHVLKNFRFQYLYVGKLRFKL
jgi:hypothetical protein